MWFSPKIKYLLIISFGIIGLALAANEGLKETERIKIPARQGIPYPYVPLDIDPHALDSSSVTTSPRALPTPPKITAPRPVVSAEAYLVANLETGEVYSSHNAGKVFPIASLSKLVTALVASHSFPSTQKVTITPAILEAYGEAGHLALGETFTVSELMYPLLLESSNDAAEALAQSSNYVDFLQKMNAFTANLGMTSTSFHDASGLSSGNISNANDLLKLARYIYTSEKPLLELTRQMTMSVASTTDHGAHTWNTINPFPNDPHFLGGKTGRTIEAKESMISLFKYTQGLITYPVAIIVLRSDISVREVDSAYLFEKFIQKIEEK